MPAGKQVRRKRHAHRVPDKGDNTAASADKLGNTQANADRQAKPPGSVHRGGRLAKLLGLIDKQGKPAHKLAEPKEAHSTVPAAVPRRDRQALAARPVAVLLPPVAAAVPAEAAVPEVGGAPV